MQSKIQNVAHENAQFQNGESNIAVKNSKLITKSIANLLIFERAYEIFLPFRYSSK